MARMRRRSLAATLLAALSLVAATPAAPAARPPTAHAACTSATIEGKHKCIARGQYCARRYQRDYRRYGLKCSKRDSRGRWHLQ